MKVELVKVLKVQPEGEAGLRLWFSTGETGVRDFRDMIAAGGPMVEPLSDQAFFARVFVQNGVVAWPNGLDLDAIALHDEMARAGLLNRAAA